MNGREQYFLSKLAFYSYVGKFFMGYLNNIYEIRVYIHTQIHKYMYTYTHIIVFIK